jgi:tetratricopeptide (TPR) repeat protein
MKSFRNPIAVTFICAGILGASVALADQSPRSFSLNGNADLCFAEAEKASAATDASELSTMPCRRALRNDPISRADRSAMLHNRGVIEQAQGNLEAAKASFARAVRLSATIDQRNLALAQVAHKLGDLELAIRQYDLVIRESTTVADASATRRVIANRRSAAEAIRMIGIASR